jgi:hypothetical protein
MAARIRKLIHDAETRARIKTTQLANRLTKHAFGELELSQSQVRAIEILLRKTLPDLSTTTLAGDANNPLRWEAIQRNVIDPHDLRTHLLTRSDGHVMRVNVVEPKHVNGSTEHTNGSGIQTTPDSEPL